MNQKVQKTANLTDQETYFSSECDLNDLNKWLAIGNEWLINKFEYEDQFYSYAFMNSKEKTLKKFGKKTICEIKNEMMDCQETINNFKINYEEKQQESIEVVTTDFDIHLFVSDENNSQSSQEKGRYFDKEQNSEILVDEEEKNVKRKLEVESEMEKSIIWKRNMTTDCTPPFQYELDEKIFDIESDNHCLSSKSQTEIKTTSGDIFPNKKRTQHKMMETESDVDQCNEAEDEETNKDTYDKEYLMSFFKRKKLKISHPKEKQQVDKKKNKPSSFSILGQIFTKVFKMFFV